jgi:hypothetical protein
VKGVSVGSSKNLLETVEQPPELMPWMLMNGQQMYQQCQVPALSHQVPWSSRRRQLTLRAWSLVRVVISCPTKSASSQTVRLSDLEEAARKSTSLPPSKNPLLRVKLFLSLHYPSGPAQHLPFPHQSRSKQTFPNCIWYRQADFTVRSYGGRKGQFSPSRIDNSLDSTLFIRPMLHYSQFSTNYPNIAMSRLAPLISMPSRSYMSRP